MQFSLPILALAAGAVAETFTIQVADQKGDLIYTPNSVVAKVGDTVQFLFNPKNHTVTEADFSSPCVPLSGGFNSGFNPTVAGAAEQIAFTYTVADTNPHWFYCAQGKHCESGMVGVINPPSSGNTLDAFTSAAKQVGASKAAPEILGGTLSNVTAQYNTTLTTTAAGNQVTSYAPTVISTNVVITNSDGQVQTSAIVETSSVPVLISSQAGAKGQLVGLGAAVAGVAAMFL